jgi:hypothetical protein
MSEVIKFEADKAGIFGTPNALRERKVDRELRVKALLAAGPLTFVSMLGMKFGTALADGKTLEVGNTQMAIANPESLRCVICHGIHGKPTKNEERAGNKTWKANRLALISLFTQNGKALPVSETCVAEYILPIATQKTLTNYADVVKLYGFSVKK